jgi:hypothetical protein
MDVEREAQGFAHAGFFKGRADENRLAGTREDQGEETFAEAPANAREVVERRSRADDEAVKGWRNFGHAILRVKEAIVEIIGREGADAVPERLEVGETGGKLRRCGLRFGESGGRGREGGGGDGGGGMEKTATRDGSHERKGWGGRRRRVKEESVPVRLAKMAWGAGREEQKK